MTKALWLLHDQCDIQNPLFEQLHHDDYIIMVESAIELDTPYTHIKKTAFIIATQRHFIQEVHNKSQSHLVYLKLDECEGLTQIQALLKVSNSLNIDEALMIKPKSWTHREQLKNIEGIKITQYPDPNLISDETLMLPWFKSKSFRMETFYQHMRQVTGLLMDEHNKPMGGKYNFDKQNQQALKSKPQPFSRISFKKDDITLGVIKEVQQRFAHQLGDLNQFYFSHTRKQALIECDHFIKHILPFFGLYQDNMIQDDPFIAHSLLSAYLNIGLLQPREVCQKVHNAALSNTVPIEAAEGFIRQILGWREYMFYKYHALMPDLLYAQKDLDYHPLPSFYWGAPTKMNCLHQSVKDSLNHAYSHHIQRLMVSANFANLARIKPFEVHEWFLGIYADAYEWVEVPNTLGMGLYKDQGQIASKPYISSGAYINKMSNYCKDCFYDPKQLIGERACPFNSLYWQYIADHKASLKSNPRMSMMLASYESFTDEKKEYIANQTQLIFKNLKEGQL